MIEAVQARPIPSLLTSQSNKKQKLVVILEIILHKAVLRYMSSSILYVYCNSSTVKKDQYLLYTCDVFYEVLYLYYHIKKYFMENKIINHSPF